MKFIITLLVLSFLTFINATNSVYNQFLITGKTCISKGEQITLNACTKACGAQQNIVYNKKTGEYILSTYDSSDDTCYGQYVQNTFNCSTDPVATGVYSIGCSNPMDQVSFSSFNFHITDNDSNCDATVGLDQCISSCNTSVTIVPSDTIYAGYNLTLYSDDKCKNVSDSMIINCLNDNTAFEFTPGNTLICESGASIVNYSIFLLFSILLLNFLL